MKISRIIKRRTVANEAADAGRVTVNGKPAKPSKELKEGDIIGMRFGSGEVRFKVLVVPEGNSYKGAPENLYEVINGK